MMVEQNKWRSTVEQIKRSFTTKGRTQLNAYSIEGIRLHERALHAAQTLVLTVVSHSFWQDPTERAARLKNEITLSKHECIVIPDEVMNELTNGRSLGDILSLVEKPNTPDLEGLVTAVPNPTLLIAQGIIDPGNIGAMIRTAHANNATAFIVCEGSDPYHPKAVRTTMGSIFKMPVVSISSINDLLQILQRLNIETVGAVAENGVLLPAMHFSQKGTALFMGNEYFGLPDQLINQLNRLITIPMATGIDSMSVNAATAVVLYEIQRQK